MFICGSRSFGHEDDEKLINSHYPISKRTRRSLSLGKIIARDNHNKNPYADRGLEKFYALLAELDEKKQKIYTELGSEEISFVRFVYSHGSDGVRPIIVRVNKDSKKQEKNSQELKTSEMVTNNPEAVLDKSPKAITSREEMVPKERSLMFSFRVIENLKKPYNHFAIFVVLVLLFLAIYGRAFAILCTTVGWYTVPTIAEGSSSSSSKRIKKGYVRKQSDKKVVVSEEGPSSPRSVIHGLCS